MEVGVGRAVAVLVVGQLEGVGLEGDPLELLRPPNTAPTVGEMQMEILHTRGYISESP